MPSDLRPDRRALTLGSRLQGFQDLGRFRVHDILLVATLYDSFMLSEDGQVSEAILGEFVRLDPYQTPGITRVSSAAEALAIARAERRHNLVVTSLHPGDLSAPELARRLHAQGIDVPVVALAYDARDLADLRGPAAAPLDRVFVWQGDFRILPAIVKDVEDRRNVAFDTGVMGVQAILVIEDSVRFYSSFLPAIYAELIRHSHNVTPEGLNLSQRLLRIRARPKILLCRTFEEAWAYFDRYQENILGVISDFAFPKGGAIADEAGLEFARLVRACQPDVPIMLQSAKPENEARARTVGAAFLLKGSPTLLHQLQRFMIDNFGFGDFVFRLADGTTVAQAKDLRSLEERLRTVPAESIAYHAERNHFSNWLKARTEFSLAHYLRPRKLADFPTVEDLRHELIRAIHDHRRRRDRGIVADFDPETFDAAASFCRIGGGSLGGKGRGLAFVNFVLTETELTDRFPGVQVSVPAAVILGSELFEAFLDYNHLQDFAIRCQDDEVLRREFEAAAFPPEVEGRLAALLGAATYPLAVRSSSLLEDSQQQPFAGIYDTWMLPNNHLDPRVRLAQLLAAIKRVYASTYSQRSKMYLAASPYRLEEERMAVIVQRVVGARHAGRFYPDCAGVARSHNFYPVPPMQTEDGIAAVALGLGATVVEGEVCFRFCPRYPQHPVQFVSVDQLVANSQRAFHALRLEDGGHSGFELGSYGLDCAERDGTLAWLGSTYSPENHAVYDGVSRPGVRLVSFAPVLKHRLFPLAQILAELLDACAAATGVPVEIEFAVNLSVPAGAPKEFGFLQLRPLIPSRELSELEIGDVAPAAVICRSGAVLGHGKIDTIRDVVVVDVHRFDRARSADVAREVGRLNAALTDAGAPYALIGVGRWGSTEPFLGIPVTWEQISGARVIVEAGFRDVKVTPSQGSHFFQNLTASNVGYFTVNPQAGEGFVDWDWLAAQPAAADTGFVRHLRFVSPVVVRMNGRRRQGVILKPGA